MSIPLAVRLPAAALAVVVLAGCGAQHPAHDARQLITVAEPPSPYSTQPSSPSTGPAVADPDPAAGAVTVARAFTGEICPYSYRDSRPYGQRLNTALTRWGTPAFAAAHRWSPARIVTAAAGLVQEKAEQVCGQVTGGTDPEPGTASSGRVVVRLSVTVTAHSATGPASSAQQVFTYALLRGPGGRWLIDNGQW